MRLFLSNFLFVLFSSFAQASPPVIWYGSDAKFINSGTLLVPGLAPGGVCKIDSSGYFSAGTIPPSSIVGGTANRFAGFDNSGVLTSFSNWTRNSLGGSDVNQTVTPTDTGSTASYVLNNHSSTFNPTNNLANTYLYGNLDQIELNGTNDYLGVEGNEFSISQNGANSITGDLIGFFPRINLGSGGGVSSSANDTIIKGNIRTSGNHTAQQLVGIESQVSMDGGSSTNEATSLRGSTYVGGTANNAYGISQTTQIAGTLNQTVYGINNSTLVDSGATAANVVGINSFFNGDLTQNYTGATIGVSSGTIAGSSTDLNVYHSGTVTQNSSMINLGRDGASSANFSMIQSNLNSSSPITSDFRQLSLLNDAAVGGFGAGSLIYQNGAVTKGFTGYGVYTNANLGDGTGVTIAGVDVTLQNGTTAGGTTGFSFNNSNTTTGNNTVFGSSINNSGSGYRFSGVFINNNSNQSEEIQGFKFNSTGDARTQTGFDLAMTGTVTDDAQAIRVNVNNLTTSSTSQHVTSMSLQGGLLSVQSAFTPFSGATVEVGNGLSVLDTIQSGSPLTGTDQIITLIQSNLLAQDDISTGPVGLDTTMFGAVSQIVIDSGKTVPLMRSMLLGTSVPSGSGGTLSEHVVLEILGLPSFGGSLSNPTRTAIRDSQLLGQNFCDGATTCHFIDVRDSNAQNSFAGGVQLKTSATQPACDAAHRGTFWNIEGGTGVADILQICQKDATDTYVWVTK